MLGFQDRTFLMQTASIDQVRRELHTNSIRRHQHYERAVTSSSPELFFGEDDDYDLMRHG